MSTALQLHTQTMADWGVIRQQAEVLVKTGFLPQSIKTPEQAMAIILTGRELGIGAMAALNTINVIQGKPTVSPQLMLALINRTGELEAMCIDDDGQECAITMKRRGREPHTETFSMQDAARMKTTEYVGGEKKTISLSEKYNWRQMPAVMRKWRAVAACARIVFPDVILGIYTPDEMGAHTDAETGEVAEAAPETTDWNQLEENRLQAVEPEPEPVRTVKLEGAQPKDAPAEELRALCRKLGFTDAQLLKWLTNKYGLTEGLTLGVAMDSLQPGELSQAIDLFTQKVEESK